MYNTSLSQQSLTSGKTPSYKTNYLDSMSDDVASSVDTLVGDEHEGPLTKEEKAFLDKIADALARLGRVKRVALGVKEKQDFVRSWTKSRR